MAALRILYVVYDDLSVQSAASINTAGRIRALVSLGCEVRLVCAGKPVGLPEGMSVDVFEPEKSFPFAGRRLRARINRWLGWCFGLYKPHVVMTRGLLNVPAKSATKCRIPVFAEAHGCLKDEMEAVGTKAWRVKFAMAREKVAVKYLTGVVALDETVKRRLVELWPSLHGRITCIPNGVDLDRFPPVDSERRREIRSNHGLSEADTVLAFCGMLWDIYDFRGVFEAMSQRPSWKFIVAGDGPIRATVEQQARDAGVHERCMFLGKVDSERVREVYAASDAGVLPNVPAMAGLHLKVFEYAAAGLPLVAPICSDLEFLERDGMAALTNGLGASSLLARVDEMGASGAFSDERRALRRRYASENFSWRSRMERILEFCRSKTEDFKHGRYPL